jgi:hypothetical protein
MRRQADNHHCDTCCCNNCDTGHMDLNIELVKCLITKKPECPGEHSLVVCVGRRVCPANGTEEQPSRKN